MLVPLQGHISLSSVSSPPSEALGGRELSTASFGVLLLSLGVLLDVLLDEFFLFGVELQTLV